MTKEDNKISVFEHESIRYDKGEKRITKEQFLALEKYFGTGLPYYSLIYHGVQFNEHVGVIQVGKTVIEVLPKADKHDTDENKWRRILIGMLRTVRGFDVKSTSSSHLKIKPNTILDLYFEMFIREVEYLVHNGLIKQYRRKEGNVTSLKGSLLFGKHIQQNLVHQERFYVRHATYDVEHKLHFILYKTIRLLRQINTNSDLHGRIGSLLLHFPEMPDIQVAEATFERLVFTRKNLSYKKAVEIAKLLLLQYHPDLSSGRNHVLALMFDMNVLWEQFVYRSLSKHISSDTTIVPQSSKFFWKPENGRRTSIKPDIVLNKDEDNCVVLDTKWKNLNGKNPSPDDLRQMYVYLEYYKAERVALVYPGPVTPVSAGTYLHPDTGEKDTKHCSVITLAAEEEVKKWQENISQYFADHLKLTLKQA